MVYKRITLDISEPQIRKLADGKAVSLSASQLKGSGTSLMVHPETYNKIQKAKKKGSGTRIQIEKGEMMADLNEGGSVWRWMKEKLWPALKPLASEALDNAVPLLASKMGPYGRAATLGRQAVRELTGVGVSKMGKGTPEMKAHMASLRARRKPKSSMQGASFRLY